MTPNLLVLGGTTEANALCSVVAQRQLKATLSLAGRVDTPKASPLPTRVGGFGGTEGMVRFLRDTGVTHVIDATHPFGVSNEPERH